MKTLQDIVAKGEATGYFSALAKSIELILPSIDGNPDHRCHFVLLVADNSEVAQYVSNAERESCIQWLRETADRLEKNEDTPR